MFKWLAGSLMLAQATIQPNSIETPDAVQLTFNCVEASQVPASAIETTIFRGQVRWAKLKVPSGQATFGFWLPGLSLFCFVDQATETPEL